MYFCGYCPNDKLKVQVKVKFCIFYLNCTCMFLIKWLQVVPSTVTLKTTLSSCASQMYSPESFNSALRTIRDLNVPSSSQMKCSFPSIFSLSLSHLTTPFGLEISHFNTMASDSTNLRFVSMSAFRRMFSGGSGRKRVTFWLVAVMIRQSILICLSQKCTFDFH